MEEAGVIEESAGGEDVRKSPKVWTPASISTKEKKPVAADDVDGRRGLAEYLLRAPFCLQKITWKAETATVIYRSGRNWKLEI